MRHLARSIILLAVFICGFAGEVRSQSVLNPADPLVTYDPNNPPPLPPYGQIGKWARTVRMSWNTDMYKAYIYKGLAFRLHFPKTYNPTAVDGKKYPLMIFFHGHGEYGPIEDNEFHLLHGHQGFSQAINNGTFDGYVLSPQSTFFFNITDYEKLIEIVEYMIANNKVDPFHITANGLSQGGQASWEMVYNFPTYMSAALPMSWTQSSFADPTFVNKVKYTPIWHFQGLKDINPTPATTYQVRDAMLAAGADFTLTEYADVGHGTWWLAWGEKNFWPYINKAYSSNPWQLGGRKDYWPGQAINATVGLPAGFGAYEWRKDGVLISGATSNTINVTAGGVYDARVQRNGTWSEWSRQPLVIKPGKYEAENYTLMSGVLTENTLDVGGGKDVGWIETGDWMEYAINVTSAGTYTLKLRIATPNTTGAQVLVKKGDGSLLSTVNISGTGGWQVWQTISTTVTLAAGTQNIRFQSSGTAGWNFNWFEFSGGNGSTPSNQPPTVNAGPDKSITLPTSSVSLSGSASDADGSIASYQWTKVSGGAATITSPSSASTTITGLVQGSYVFRLTVTDNGGATASDEVSVTVNAEPAPGSGTRIEAENYTAMSGVVKENTTDAGGGQQLGYIDTGDWM
ncbi:MAG TPA: carbohydrate-binding protein, partial [Chitinophagaceae bacterium]